MKTFTQKTLNEKKFADVSEALAQFDHLTAISSKHYVIAEGMDGSYYIMLKEDAEGLKNIVVDRPIFTDNLAAEEERAHLEDLYQVKFAIRYQHNGSMYVCRA